MIKIENILLVNIVVLLIVLNFFSIKNLEATEKIIAQNETEGERMKLEKFQEQVFFSTVRITRPNKTGTGASIGTGFLFRVSLNDKKNRGVVLLVSNRHVFADPSSSLILNFNRKKSDSLKPELGQVIPMKGDEFKDIYQGHPDPSVDLACINVSSIDFPENNVFFKSLFPEMLSDFSEVDLLPGVDVWFVGYPENRFDTVNNLPLLRRGYIASIPKIDFNSKKQFVIDAQVFPGSSGSPVFAALGGNFKLIGVVAETMIRNEQLQAIPTGTVLGVEQILGLGIVIKSSLVKELIDYAAEQIRLKLEKQDVEPTIGKSRDGNQG
ncbi:MAG: serine protease [Candidatus Omnitrophica bacterium]|jgi:hypothetical protein|nr:serine protease [Candidatus Omnitrophota bacterium]